MGSTDQSPFPKPLKQSGALERFTYKETTPVIGREFLNVNIVDDLLNAPNADELIRDLAITSILSLHLDMLDDLYLTLILVSERGVVFFRKQDNLTNALQKQLNHRLGQLSGKPSTSTLHIHPVLNNSSEFGVDDAEISTISSFQRKALFKDSDARNRRRYDAAQWHSDIQFEPTPADYFVTFDSAPQVWR